MSGMEIGAILAALPERYPLLLVDRVLEMDPGVRAVGLKNVTINEEFFRGHFPDHPVMPGVLILEALAQLGRLILGSDLTSRARIVAVESARFRKPVIPGDALRLEVDAEKIGDGMWRMHGRAHVEELLVAEATLQVVADGAQR